MALSRHPEPLPILSRLTGEIDSRLLFAQRTCLRFHPPTFTPS